MTVLASEIETVSRHSVAAVRFEVLDSWRGICALLVALYHFPVATALSQSPFLVSSYLFVDFFFVLSGFVIMASSGAKLRRPDGVARFAIVRFGRVYPLHLFMLAAYVGFEVVRQLLPQLRSGSGVPFTEGTNIPSLFTNLLLLQSLGLERDRLTWNLASWSISAEFFTYLAFAAVMFIFRARAWLIFAVVALGLPLLIVLSGAQTMDLTYHLGFVRCLFGFSLGALIAWFQHDAIVSKRQTVTDGMDRGLWTTAEIAMVTSIILFIGGAGDNQLSIATPFVFALALYLFAHEGGAVSSLLRSRGLLWLGALSYSIYMVHMFVQSRMLNALTLVDRKLGLGWIGEINHHGETILGFGPNSIIVGSWATLVMLAATLMTAYVTWRFVEMPALAYFRRIAGKI